MAKPKSSAAKLYQEAFAQAAREAAARADLAGVKAVGRTISNGRKDPPAGRAPVKKTVIRASAKAAR